jgi:hypothetical protein
MSVRIVKCFHAQVINVSAQCDSNKICFCSMSKMFPQITKISREFFPTWTAIVLMLMNVTLFPSAPLRLSSISGKIPWGDTASGFSSHNGRLASCSVIHVICHHSCFDCPYCIQNLFRLETATSLLQTVQSYHRYSDPIRCDIRLLAIGICNR